MDGLVDETLSASYRPALMLYSLVHGRAVSDLLLYDGPLLTLQNFMDPLEGPLLTLQKFVDPLEGPLLTVQNFVDPLEGPLFTLQNFVDPLEGP